MSQSEPRQLEYIPLTELDMLTLRDVREHVVSDIQQRINESGYNPARPLRVVKADDSYRVADGNHRVQALRDAEDVAPDTTVPCVVEPADADVYAVAHESNKDEDTYAEQDLFDRLDYINGLRDEHTQAQIAERLSWSRSKVARYSQLLNKTVTDVRLLARRHQGGRVTRDVTAVTDFSEYWFRNSGLYSLSDEEPYALPDEEEAVHPQVRVMRWFCVEERCDASSNQLSKRVSREQQRCEQLSLIEDELAPGVDDDDRDQLRKQVAAAGYNTERLKQAIESLNQDAKDRVLWGTGAVEALDSVESNTVDCVITDPPYGEGFTSVRETENPEFEDGSDAVFEALDAVFEELQRVAKENAHLYVFFSMTHYERVMSLLGEYFEVEPTPLIWVKNNHTPNAPAAGGFRLNYAQKYEPILHCRMPAGDERELNGGVSQNVLEYARPSGDERRHDTQKPRQLLGELVENSTSPHETVCDPFAGSGSTLLAAKERGRNYIGTELDESYKLGFRRELQEVTDSVD